MLFIILLSLPASAGEGLPAQEFNKTGMICLENGDNEAASFYFMRAISVDPSNKYYCNNMAVSLMRRGDYEGAEKFLFHAIEIDQGYTRALSNMAVTLFHLGRYLESYSYYIRSLNSDRGYTESRFEKGKVEAVIKKLSEDKPQDKNLKRILEYLGSESN